MKGMRAVSAVLVFELCTGYSRGAPADIVERKTTYSQEHRPGELISIGIFVAGCRTQYK